MVIDTSAIVAILFDEPDQRRYGEAIEAATVRLAPSGDAGRTRLCDRGPQTRSWARALGARFFQLTGAEIVAVTPQQAEIAVDAFRRFGRGRHRASLNIGDCFCYALAAATDHALLFKGDDFGRTDIRPGVAVNRLLIRGARLLDPASGLDALGDLLVEGERIAAVGGDLSAAACDAETVMAEGLCLAPGLVDMRVQLREPGAEHMESIESGGRAAAAGGVTTMVAPAEHRPAGR